MSELSEENIKILLNAAEGFASQISEAQRTLISVAPVHAIAKIEQAAEILRKQFAPFAPALEAIKRQHEQAMAVAEAIANLAAPVIEAQRNMARVFASSPVFKFQQTVAMLADKPEFILAFALTNTEDNRALDKALSKLLKKLDNGNAMVVGEPPVLIILGETLSYEEILAIEDVSSNYHFSDDQYFNDLRDNTIRLIRDAKKHANHKFRNEIKRQDMNYWYHEASLDELLEEPSQDGLLVNRSLVSKTRRRELLKETGQDGFQKQVINKGQKDELLNSLATVAANNGWRKDRVDSMLLVAKYALDNGTLWNADKFLPIHRDTIHERKKDLRLLLMQIINPKPQAQNKYVQDDNRF